MPHCAESYFQRKLLGNVISELKALQQAANKVFFQPVEDDIKITAKMLDLQRWKEWTPILGMIGKGEAIAKGCFQLEGDSKCFFDTLCVKI